MVKVDQKILYKADARKALQEGVNKLTNVVQSTLGPSGKCVILDLESGNPVSTKDGVTVAKAVNLPDPLENTGAQMVKQASIKTAEEAGDGTTTATVLARSMYEAGLKTIEAGSELNGVSLKKGIEEGVEFIVDFLEKKVSKDVSGVEQLKQVATISANGDVEIGELVSSALDQVGREGAVTIEESKSGETYLDMVEGVQFDRGFKSPYMVTDNATMTAVLEDVLILIVDKKLTTVKELIPILESVAASTKSLLIIAEDISGELLSTLVLNKVRGGLKVCAVKAPEFGDRRKEALEDIAILTGGTVVSPEKGMKVDKFDPEWFGTADKVTVTKDKTTIIGAHGTEDAIKVRVDEIKSLIDKTDSSYDKEQYQTRLARFAGGVAVMFVGGHTEAEMKERKDRVDDALHATKAAYEEGICPGGGKALLAAAVELRKHKRFNEPSAFGFGLQIVEMACEVPFCQILSNTGMVDEEVEKLKETAEMEKLWNSYNPLTKTWMNMQKAGIVDPTKVIRLALKNAASVAGTMLTSEALVVNVPEKDEAGAAGPGMY